MKPPKNMGQEPDRDGSIALLLRFLARHGEKIIAGGVIVAALWIALQTRFYQPLPWPPDELEQLADDTEDSINKNTYSIAEEKVKVFDFVTYAEQIKTQIPTEPYRYHAEWNPAIHPDPLPRSGFKVLTAEVLRGEAFRRVSAPTPESAERWQRPPLSGTQTAANDGAIWVNVYGTIPLWAQWDVYNQVFETLPENNRPKYIYYELEKAEINQKEELVWQPVIVYPDYPKEDDQTNLNINSYSDFSLDRLVPFEQRLEASPEQTLDAGSMLLFSDFDVAPARTYAYRIRLYLVNPNYNLQETSVEAGVDTKNELVRSDWSAFARIYVPDRTLVQLQSVTPTDPVDFPRQTAPLRPVWGTLFLDYYDMELGQSLPLVEKTNVLRGMLGNMSKKDANKYINKGKPADETISDNYPDTGLRSDVCVMDFSGGRKLQKRQSRESQGSPELSVAGRALLLMPDGTMQEISTEQELFP